MIMHQTSELKVFFQRTHNQPPFVTGWKCNLLHQRHPPPPPHEKADGLPKRGSRQSQRATNIALDTAKQTHEKAKTWLTRLAAWGTGRAIYRYVSSSDRNANIKYLTKKDQSAIFRLCTQHIPLNLHLNRICQQHTTVSCLRPDETVDYHLFEFNALNASLLPPGWNKPNTFF